MNMVLLKKEPRLQIKMDNNTQEEPVLENTEINKAIE